MTIKTSEPVRVAIRTEGDWVVAYYAKTENMKGAMEVGRMRLTIIQAVPENFDRFKTIVSDAMRQHLIDLGYTPIKMDERPAPESERSGNA